MRTHPVFNRFCLLLCLTLGLSFHLSYGQDCAAPTVFTWEGAFRGNKSVWKVDDVINNYLNVNGVNVQVKLIDPFGQNTDSDNPSEFNDYTKTNTFYGRGALALQITSQKHHQPVCLEFAFSKPIILRQFNVWDVDFITSSMGPEHSFQDSITVSASMDGRDVPVNIVPRVSDYSFRIIDQSMVSNYILGTDGDLAHSDPKGSAILSTNSMINKFTLCYENGPLDDGISNSQALKITDFTFCEVKGSILGHVYDKTTSLGIPETRLNLLHASGEPVLDIDGQPIFTLTDSNGFYSFLGISTGDYIIQSVNKAGYESDSDLDSINDDKVAVHIGVDELEVANINFYDIQASVLPVKLVGWEISKASNGFDVNWQVLSETNSDYYVILTSHDGKSFKVTAQVSSKAWSNTGALDYSFFVQDDLKNDVYVRLEHVDLDGKVSSFGTKKVKGNFQNFNVIISPNPTEKWLSVRLEGIEEADIKIINITGQIIHTPIKIDKSIDILIEQLPKGEYFLQCHTKDNQVVTKKFIKI